MFDINKKQYKLEEIKHAEDKLKIEANKNTAN